MDYAIDPILPIVKQSIRNSVEKINNLSNEQYIVFLLTVKFYLFIDL